MKLFVSSLLAAFLAMSTLSVGAADAPAEPAAKPDAAKVAKPDLVKGEALFTAVCAACHGADAKGVAGTGAPDLTDSDWVYGSDAVSLRQTLMAGRQGQMPSWQSRLTEAEIRAMALYVERLSEPAP